MPNFSIPSFARRPARTIVAQTTLRATLATIVTLGLSGPVLAQEEMSVVPRAVVVDWTRVIRDARSVSRHLIELPPTLDPSLSVEFEQQLSRYVTTDKEAARPLARLNTFMAALYPGVESVPIPVLAPIATDRYLGEFVRSGASAGRAAVPFLSAAVSNMHFIAKTTGYDAILTVDPGWLERNRINGVDLAQVHLGGSGILYGERNAARDAAGRGTLVRNESLQAKYPGLRRSVGADDVSFNFIRYGVLYFAGMVCRGKEQTPTNIISCDRTDAVLQTVLEGLHLIGGAPIALPRQTDACRQPRPTAVHPTFRFFPPGDLPKAISQKQMGGVTTKVCHGPSNLYFPIKEPPVFANSQLFMHAGNCHGQKQTLTGGRYKCLLNPARILEPREGHIENYSPPWRDTYCEVRNEVGREPRGCPEPVKGHEGQDIRPRDCVDNNGRCAIDRHRVVAVTKGSAWWKENNHLKLSSNDGTGLYYMYMHMSTDALREAMMIRGVPVNVERGQPVGAVGNWIKTDANKTTAHLHFEIRDPREMCGKYACPVSPYWTLIRSYERLIEARGTEATIGP